MEQACLTIPVLPGRTDAALDLMRALEGTRRSEYEASLQQIGVTKHLWFLATGPGGDELVAYLECAGGAEAFEVLARSRAPFDRWFKAALAEVTGVDLGDLPRGTSPPRLLSHYAG